MVHCQKLHHVTGADVAKSRIVDVLGPFFQLGIVVMPRPGGAPPS